MNILLSQCHHLHSPQLGTISPQLVAIFHVVIFWDYPKMTNVHTLCVIAAEGAGDMSFHTLITKIIGDHYVML